MATSTNPPNASTKEQITPQLSREFIENGKIVVYHIGDVTRTDVDAAYAIMAKTMDEWDMARPYRAINHFAMSNAVLSPYAQKRLREIRTHRPDLKGYVAVVMPRGIVATVIKLFARSNPGVRENAFFHTPEDALAWLRTK